MFVCIVLVWFLTVFRIDLYGLWMMAYAISFFDEVPIDLFPYHPTTFKLVKHVSYQVWCCNISQLKQQSAGWSKNWEHYTRYLVPLLPLYHQWNLHAIFFRVYCHQGIHHTIKEGEVSMISTPVLTFYQGTRHNLGEQATIWVNYPFLSILQIRWASLPFHIRFLPFRVSASASLLFTKLVCLFSPLRKPL